MSDYIADTPVVIPPACPKCEPDRDPREYDVRWCDPHAPKRDGAEDDSLLSKGIGLAYLSSGGEAGGADNAAACALIHRKRLITGGPSA